jgi:hypothetical protein
MKTIKTAPTHCPKCNEVLDALTPTKEVGERPPQEGDIAICANCATICSFTNELKLEPITKEFRETIKNSNPKLFSAMMISILFIKLLKHIDAMEEEQAFLKSQLN